MKKIDDTPFWVQLAYASVPSRKIALWLIGSCVLFTVYCVPWTHFTDNMLVKKLFMLNDWWWFASMIPLTIWYWLALKWSDKHAAWIGAHSNSAGIATLYPCT